MTAFGSTGFKAALLATAALPPCPLPRSSRQRNTDTPTAQAPVGTADDAARRQ